jgi:riboflavin synthase
MFTGIVEERGVVGSQSGSRLEIACRTVVDCAVGESLSVSGACLTVIDRADGRLCFDLARETLDRTNLGSLRPGDGVNLERPVTLLTRLGGHLVQGHVDGVATVISLEPERNGSTLAIEIPSSLERYVVEKGSIAIDGVSLTVAAVRDAEVRIALIPHTLAATTLGSVQSGDRVNVEVDLIAKYVERLQEATA